MNKFLVKNEANDILRIYPLDNYASPAILPNETHELLPAETELLLPENFYAQQARPEHINLTDVNSFELLPGKYGVNAFYVLSASWAGEVCTIEVTRKISAHTEIAKTDGIYADLGPNDIAAIISSEMPEAVDTAFSNDIPVSIFGQNLVVTLVNGVGSFELNYAGNELVKDPGCYVDGNYCVLSWQAPASIAAVITLRNERDTRLAACDWLVIRHTTQDVKTLIELEYSDLKTYMQALRDLPANTADPANPPWPDKPSFMS